MALCQKNHCLTNLLEFLEYVTQYTVDCGEAIDIIYLDFQKAFDKVSRVKLLKNWKHME